MRLTALELQSKSTRDASAIAGYKKQIAQLAACIADREGRIARRTPIIAKISQREIAEWDAKVEVAKALTLIDGAEYSTTSGEEWTARDLQDGRWKVSSRTQAYTGPYELLSVMFFTDNPDAKVLRQSADK